MGRYLDRIRQHDQHEGTAPIETVKPKETLRQQALTQRPETDHALQAGDLIEWSRGGQAQTGEVDYLHVDDTGTRLAFVTIGDSWAVVNVKFVKRMSGGYGE